MSRPDITIAQARERFEAAELGLDELLALARRWQEPLRWPATNAAQAAYDDARAALLALEEEG